MAITNYKLNDARMFADVADNLAIIIDASSGIYFGMNGYGTGIFKNLLDGSSVDDVVAAAQQLPGAPEDVATSIQAFIETLLGFDIILPADAESTRPCELVEKDAQYDQFVPTCNEYSDVQELLYADPIHEVDETEGWKPI